MNKTYYRNDQRPRKGRTRVEQVWEDDKEGGWRDQSIWAGQSPGWALVLIHAVWPALLNPILNYLCCVPPLEKTQGLSQGWLRKPG